MPSDNKIKSWLDSLQTLFTILAIVAGGVWFYWQGAMRPDLKIEHHVSSRTLVDQEGDRLVSVEEILENVGRVPVDLPCGYLKVFDINPGSGGPDDLIWPAKDQPQPAKKYRRIEPGERGSLHNEIVVPEKIKTVRLHSFYYDSPNCAKPGKGWEYISVYDLEEPAAAPKALPSGTAGK